jgi:hypothetical protein
VGVERPRDISLPESSDDHGATRALAQGVREACIDPATHLLRPPARRTCKLLGDAPTTGVCVDETSEAALSTEIECQPGDLTAQAIDLSRSGCEAASCYEVEARRAGATHLLVVVGGWQTGGFTVSGRITDLSDGSVHPFAPTDFASGYSIDWPRTGPQVLGILKWLARSETGEKLVEQKAADRAVEKGAAAPAIVAVAPPPLPSSAPPEPAGRAWVGWTLIGAGVAAGVAGGIVWSMNGDGRDCAGDSGADQSVCRRRLKTAVPSLALGAAALGGLIGGTVVLIKEARGRGDVTLILHPSSVALGGTF